MSRALNVARIVLDPRDSAAVLPDGGRAGDSAAGLVLRDEIPRMHKAALRDMRAGEPVIKCGRAIGTASVDVRAGDWLHTHDIAPLPLDAPQWSDACAVDDAELPEPDMAWMFMGFRRSHGRAATRNDLLIVPTSRELVGEARRIASCYHRPYWIDSVRVAEHGMTSSTDDASRSRTIRAAAGLMRNPNFISALVIESSSSCVRASDIISEVGIDAMIRSIKNVNVDIDSEARMMLRLDELAGHAPRVREQFPLADLRVGVRVSAPDGTAAATAAPLVGLLADMLTSCGGTVISSDAAAISAQPELAADRIADLRVFERYEAMRAVLADEPRPLSPIELRGGLSTTAERALAYSSTTGCSLITRMMGLAEHAGGSGVMLMYSPDDDVTSCSALAAAGAQLIINTARRHPFTSVVPTIRVDCSDTADFDASPLLRGESMDCVSRRLASCVSRVAGGERTRGEASDTADFFI